LLRRELLHGHREKLSLALALGRTEARVVLDDVDWLLGLGLGIRLVFVRVFCFGFDATAGVHAQECGASYAKE
jgi:hypothetical protein